MRNGVIGKYRSGDFFNEFLTENIQYVVHNSVSNAQNRCVMSTGDVHPPQPLISRHSPRKITAPKYVYAFGDPICIDDILQSAINGLDPQYIDPSFFGYLYPELQEKHQSLLKEGNISAACAAKKCHDHIILFYQKKQRKEEQERLKLQQREEYEEMQRQKEEEKRLRQVSPEVLNKNVDYALSGLFDQIPSFVYKKLVRELRKLQEEAIANNDYKSAGQYDTAARRVSVLAQDQRYREITSQKAAGWQERVATARRGLSETREVWNGKITEAKTKRDKNVDVLQEDMEKAIEEYDHKFELEIPAQFRKPSPQYLQLKEQEKFLVMSKRFLEAKALHDEANELLKKENEIFRERYARHLNSEKAQCEKRMKDRIFAKECRTADGLFVLERDGHREIRHAKMALKRMEMHYDEAESLASITPRPQPLASTGKLGRSQGVITRSPRAMKLTRSCEIHRPFAKTPQEVFRQQRAINHIIYSKMQVQ